MPLTRGSIDDLTNGGAALRVTDEDHYDLVAEGPALDRCTFRALGLKRAKLIGGTIKNCVFEQCYLRNAKFTNVNLTGTRFSNCNLRHASFEMCTLWYVTFENCDLNYRQLLEQLPAEENQRLRLLHTLRMNALQRGDDVFARTLLIRELQAERADKHSTWSGASEYYRRTYKGRDRWHAFWDWAGHKLQQYLWGYGLRVGVLVRVRSLKDDTLFL